ncbi:MAG: type VI secretion system tube protein Hcp [Alphaproteobacteria bacterium]|nr:type VI secretion system tube protein Hcp [Alphaproteobacteria bacterium]
MPIFIQMGLPGEDNRLKGPVAEPPHVDWFELSSVQFGISRHATYPGAPNAADEREGTEPVFRELVITMPDQGPLFFKASMDGGPFKTVVIDFVRDGQSYLVFKLTDVVVASYSLSGGGDRPTVTVVLNFKDIEQHNSALSAQHDALANPVGDVLPLAVLRQLVNMVFGP